MNIAWGMRQRIVWTPLRRDENNEPVTSPSGAPEYEEAREICCRFRYCPRQTVNRAGAAVAGASTCHTKAEVREGDLLTYDGKAWPVLAVKEGVWLDGTISFRTVHL